MKNKLKLIVLLSLISSLAQAHGPGTCTTASGPGGSGGTWGDSCGERSNQGNPSGGDGGGGNVTITVSNLPGIPKPPPQRRTHGSTTTYLDLMNYCADTIGKVDKNINTIDRDFFTPTLNRITNSIAQNNNSLNYKDYDLAWEYLNAAGEQYNEARASFRRGYGGLGDLSKPTFGPSVMKPARECEQAIKDLRTKLEYMKAKIIEASKAEEKARREEEKKRVANKLANKDVETALDRLERRNNAERIRTTDPLPPVQRAIRIESLVQQTNTYSRQILSQVSGQMEQQASDFLEEELKLSEELAFQGVDIARCGNPTEIVRIWTDLALDISNAVNNFSLGVMSGNYGSFVTASEALIAVAHDPSLIGHLSKNMIHLLSEGPGATAEATQQAFGRVAGVYTSFKKTMLTGNAFERGEALGRIGADILIAATGHTFVLGSFNRVGQILSQVPHPKLGKAMIKVIENSPKLAPAVADATANMLKEAKAAVMRNFEPCKVVREGYIREVTGLKDVAETFLEQGHDEEFVARHVHQLRRDIGQKYKDLTPAEVRPYIYERNIANGVDPLGPSIDDMRNGYAGKRGKTWREIIDSSSTPSPKVNIFFKKTMGGAQ